MQETSQIVAVPEAVGIAEAIHAVEGQIDNLSNAVIATVHHICSVNVRIAFASHAGRKAMTVGRKNVPSTND